MSTPSAKNPCWDHIGPDNITGVWCVAYPASFDFSFQYAVWIGANRQLRCAINKWFDHSLGVDRKFSGTVEAFQIEFGNIGDVFHIWVKNNANKKDDIGISIHGTFECVDGIHRIKNVAAGIFYKDESSRVAMTLV